MGDSLRVKRSEDLRQEQDVGSMEGGVAPRDEALARCVFCGENMARDVLPRFSRAYGILILLVGLLLSMFVSLMLGLPMVVIGAYMGAANRPVWTCGACGVVVDRIRS